MSWAALLWWRPPCLMREVIVNMVADRDVAYQGVLWASRGAWLTFRNVSALTSGKEPQKMDGEMVIHRDKIAFLQVI